MPDSEQTLEQKVSARLDEFNSLGDDDEIEFYDRDIVYVTESLSPILLDIRKYSTFTKKGYFLNANYNWQIVKDNDGEVVLVPTKKK